MGITGTIVAAVVSWGLLQLYSNMVWASDLNVVLVEQKTQSVTLMNMQTIMLRTEIRDISAELRVLATQRPWDEAQKRLDLLLTDDLQNAQDQLDRLTGID